MESSLGLGEALRCNRIWRCTHDGVILRGRQRAVPQNSRNYGIVDTQTIQVVASPYETHARRARKGVLVEEVPSSVSDNRHSGREGVRLSLPRSGRTSD